MWPSAGTAAGIPVSASLRRGAQVSSVMLPAHRTPVAVLPHEQGAGEPNDGIVVGEDADDLGAALEQFALKSEKARWAELATFQIPRLPDALRCSSACRAPRGSAMALPSPRA